MSLSLYLSFSVLTLPQGRRPVPPLPDPATEEAATSGPSEASDEGDIPEGPSTRGEQEGSAAQQQDPLAGSSTATDHAESSTASLLPVRLPGTPVWHTCSATVDILVDDRLQDLLQIYETQIESVAGNPDEKPTVFDQWFHGGLLHLSNAWNVF